MIQKLKNKLKEQKGFTLIELLAVIVILGIIAAIAVPSILGLIDNSKKDAHVANAQQMVSAAKMLVASDSTYQSGTHHVTLKGLQDLKYLDAVDSPENPYAPGSVVDLGTTADATVSYVRIEAGKVTGINLKTQTGDSAVRTITLVPTSGTAISTKQLKRSLVDPQ